MIKLRELTWAGQEMTRSSDGYIVWQDTPVPEGGDRVSMGSLGMRDAGQYERATHFEVPCTAWGDYCGSSVERSNYRSLLRDYPDTFVEVLGDHFSQYLAIPCGSLDEVMAEIFTNLVEQYPLYDEEDHSMLEMEAASEQWEQWAKQDILSSLSRDYGVDTDNISEAWLEQKFWDWCSNQSEFPYLGSAASIVYPDMEGFIAEIATHFGGES